MNLRIVLVVVLLLLLALFAAINWGAFSAVDDLNLVFTRVQMPLGLLLLGFIGVLTIVYLLFSISVRTSTLVETRHYAKELEAARKVANEVEESRISALRETVETEMTALRDVLSVEAETTRGRLGESENVLIAHLGQIDDFIKGGGRGAFDADMADAGGSRPGAGSGSVGAAAGYDAGDDAGDDAASAGDVAGDATSADAG